MINDISIILSSTAKYRILRTLFLQNSSIPLRHIAYLSKLYINSVQHGIKNLLKNHLLIKKSYGREIHFSINRKHPSYMLIKDIFEYEMKRKIQARSKTYIEGATSSLNFINYSIKLFRKIQND